ncbi:hypothetical protein KL86DYS1_10438 [uncultured Dysgonomonas sp.]|uniref:Uncharacterized protein n=1 Tax=uncultured Dysgonomonas sp. TaxID=206096 RepID=A0A212IX58_9BACT|nr:hypothetical protein KL86DYS1_10438 [uncultured Dysgonomonas sp.]
MCNEDIIMSHVRNNLKSIQSLVEIENLEVFTTQEVHFMISEYCKMNDDLLKSISHE